MFTGLIEVQGIVSAIVPLDATESGGGGWSITIGQCGEILGDCHIGDSICVNGACLTATEFHPTDGGGWFKVGVAPETLDRTDLGHLKVGSSVNLERALAAHVRFGGHFVQGHVDDTVTLISKTEDGNSLRLLYQLPAPTATRPSLLPYLIPKGFVALDGTSLTVTTVDDANRTFGVMLIAHTQTKVGLSKKAIGDKINLEVDMVGKYVEKAVRGALGADGDQEGGLKAMIERAVERAVEKKLGKQ